MKNHRFTMRALLAVVAVLCGVFLLFRPIDWVGELRQAAAECDRLIIEPVPGWAEPFPNKMVIHGRDKIEKLLDAIQIDRSQSEFSCGCHGDTLLHFHKGNSRLFTLSHHHGTHLRWLDGQWPCDAYLSAHSQIELSKWFAGHGYNSFNGPDSKMVR